MTNLVLSHIVILLTFLLVILILLIVEAHYLVPCQCLLSDAVSAPKEDIHWCNLKANLVL